LISKEKNPLLDDTNRKPFSEFTEITQKTVDTLNTRGIIDLFPIQAATFHDIYNGKDVIA